jgi:hypothetical protein
MVPKGYLSSFVVESRNYAPVSCQASICDNARKTWDDENRRIEYGSAPAMIRLSTVNGPVSVRESREKLWEAKMPRERAVLGVPSRPGWTRSSACR